MSICQDLFLLNINYLSILFPENSCEFFRGLSREAETQTEAEYILAGFVSPKHSD